MPTYNTVKELSDIEKLLRAAGAEPIIADGKMSAIEIGKLRIAPEKGGPLQVWLQEKESK